MIRSQLVSFETTYMSDHIEEAGWLMQVAESLGFRCTVTSPMSGEKHYRVVVRHSSQLFSDVGPAIEALRKDIARRHAPAA